MAAALDAALPVFRERGYHGASLAELGSAMGLTVGSIYKAFSDKRAIFLAAFDRYTDLRGAELDRRLAPKRSGLEKLRAMLVFYVDSSVGAEGRLGCLVVGSATELTLFDAEMAARVTTSLKKVEARLHDLITLGRSDGSVAADINARAWTFMLLSLVQGFRVVGKTGRTRAEMIGAVDGTVRQMGRVPSN